MIDPDRNTFQNALSDFTFEAACGAAIRHLADSGCTAKQIMERLDYPVSAERVRKALYKYLCDTCVILERSPEEKLPEAKPEYIIEYDSYGKPSYRRKITEDAEGSMSGFSSAGALWKETVYRPVSGMAEQAAEAGIGEASGDSGKGILRETHRISILEMIKMTCKGSEGGVWKKAFRPSEGEKTGKAAGYPGRGAELSAFLTERSGQENETVYISCDFGIPGSAAAKGISLLNGRQQEYLEGIPWPRHRVYYRLDHRMKEILCSLYEQHAYEGSCYFSLRREKLLLSGETIAAQSPDI